MGWKSSPVGVENFFSFRSVAIAEYDIPAFLLSCMISEALMVFSLEAALAMLAITASLLSLPDFMSGFPFCHGPSRLSFICRACLVLMDISSLSRWAIAAKIVIMNSSASPSDGISQKDTLLFSCFIILRTSTVFLDSLSNLATISQQLFLLA